MVLVTANDKSDLDYVLETSNAALGVKLAGSEVNKMIRLGKPTNDGKSRPLLVSFKNYDKKEEIFKKIAGLSNAEEKFKRISIMHDMTKADRLADKKLVEQLSKGIGSKRSIVKLGSASGGTAMGPKTPKKMH